MKKFRCILLLNCFCIGFGCAIRKERARSLYALQVQSVPVTAADPAAWMDLPEIATGNADSGYQYIVAGKAFRTGIPSGLYRFINGLKESGLGRLAGYTKFTSNEYVQYKNDRGRLVATPGCLHCHAQQFNHKLIIGLGNSYSNFQFNSLPYLKLFEKLFRSWYGTRSDEWKTAERAFRAMHVLGRGVEMQVQGPQPAQKIAEIMASHRDPQSLVLRPDTAYFNVPPVVIPEDPPALWISKKRKAFAVNGMRQGDILKHITSTSLLTLKDSAEAREIYNHARDVWAFILQLQAPKYPYPVDPSLAQQGKAIFLQHCSRCHGTYGEDGHYPNLLVPGKIIGTDSLLWKYFLVYDGYTDWFNKSWFAAADAKAVTKPMTGYVPPPLDGVWITAPYLHNGSVPTIECLLNSAIRPVYWNRSFTREEYDYENLGWKYRSLSKPGGNTSYNTTIPGYGNYGHNYGDQLSEKERKAVIEYIKTL